MSFASTVRHVADVTVLDLEGRIVLGQGSGELRDSVKNLLAAGNDKILINLAGVGYSTVRVWKNWSLRTQV